MGHQRHVIDPVEGGVLLLGAPYSAVHSPASWLASCVGAWSRSTPIPRRTPRRSPRRWRRRIHVPRAGRRPIASSNAGLTMDTERQPSNWELRPVQTAADGYDVSILGGGLAGLTLAIQLKKHRPETSVLVLEKREGPAPLAAFKVGESTVPSGAHYFADVVGMRDHLEEKHIRKCGLRYFFSAGDNSDISRRFENGPLLYPPHWDYQIDRGLFENELATRARANGVDLLQGCRVRGVSFEEELHTVASARWIKLLDRRPVGRGCLGTREPAEAPTGTCQGGRAHDQCRLAAAGRRPGHRGIWGCRPGLDGAAARCGSPPAEHQPPVRRGLLGLADPAGLGVHKHRGVCRSAVPCVRGDQRARAPIAMARRARAAARGGN